MSVPVAEERINQHVPLEFKKEEESLKITGFWMFLVTDVLIFASLFSSYAVYEYDYAMGPTQAQIFTYGPVILETVLLLTSSFTIGLAVWAMRQQKKRATLFWLLLTMLLGAGFVTSEVHDFVGYVAHGWGWHHSGFLSAFFILVGTHGAHVTFGIFWALTLLFQIFRRGFTPVTTRKLFTFSLYWHFLDIVWIFIFTFVYLNGKII
jgi:cytochrome aa3-600 menaquinol oxidase subunit 3